MRIYKFRGEPLCTPLNSCTPETVVVHPRVHHVPWLKSAALCELGFFLCCYVHGSTGENFSQDFLDGVLEIVANFLCIILVNRIGRKLLLSSSLLLAGLGLLVCVVVNNYAGDDKGELMMVVLLIKVDVLYTVNASSLVHTFFHETGTETFIHFNIFFGTFQRMFSLERSVCLQNTCLKHLRFRGHKRTKRFWCVVCVQNRIIRRERILRNMVSLPTKIKIPV